MVLTDPPYSTAKKRCTGNDWDRPIDVSRLMQELFRVTKDNGCIAVFGTEPFVIDVINAGRKRFRYTLIYQKPQGSDFFNNLRKPLRDFEQIAVFYKRQPVYNPQMTSGHRAYSGGGQVGMSTLGSKKHNDSGLRYPKSVLKFTPERGLHSCHKPVALCEWLVNTYSNQGDLILDTFFGSGTTAVACQNTSRRFIGFEMRPDFVEVARKRLAGGDSSQDTLSRER
jgi:site-specific DNA-methyltransferase (adenine-specific)